MRVVLAEDLALLRDGLTRILTAYDCTVIRAVATGPELHQALLDDRPDVAIVDVRLPPTWTDEGLRAAINARAVIPGLPVLIGLPPSGDDNRRVLAVLTYLNA